ncbi:MAG: CHC2 zinc finger domain-containing protein [Planctomycetaceae bacterium]
MIADLPRIDLKELISRDLGDFTRKGSKPFWCCPFHGEKTPSMTITPDGKHFKCFGCGAKGDAVEWIKLRHGLGFKQAVEYLGGNLSSATVRTTAGNAIKSPAMPPKPARATLKPSAAMPMDSWQQTVAIILERAEAALWSPTGARALEYLQARGLTKETIKANRLGFQATDENLHGTFVSAGILIPWFTGNLPRFVQIRRKTGCEPKYRAIAGGARGEFYPMPPKVGRVVLICEGEFDAMLARQEVGDLVEVVTLGGAADQITADAAFVLACSPCILIATDTDRAGEQAAQRWLEISRGTRRIKPPGGKDITEAFTAGADLREWIHDELESVRPQAKATTEPPAELAIESEFIANAVEVMLPDGRLAMVTRKLATNRAYLRWVSGLFPATQKAID